MLAVSKFLASASVQENNTKCDTVYPLSFAFDAARYMGTWYEIQHSHGAFFQPDSFECTIAVYSNLNAEAGTFELYNSSTVGSKPRFGVHGTASIAGLPSGQVIVGSPSSTKVNYNVLDTDYETYSIIYDCSENPLIVPYLWIVGRTPTMDPTLLSTL